MNDNSGQKYVTVRDMYDKKNTSFIQRFGLLRFLLCIAVAVVVFICVILAIVIAVKKKNSEDAASTSSIASQSQYESVFDYSKEFLGNAYAYGFSGTLSGCDLSLYLPDDLKPCVEGLSECYIEGLIAPYSIDLYIYEGVEEGSPLLTSLKVTEDGYYWNLSRVCEFAEQTKDIPDITERYSQKTDGASYVYYDIKDVRSGGEITSIIQAILEASQETAETSFDNGLFSMKIAGLNYDGMPECYLKDLLKASDGALYFAVSADGEVPLRSGKLYSQSSTYTFQGEYYEVPTLMEKPDVYALTWEEYNDALVGIVKDYQAELSKHEETTQEQNPDGGVSEEPKD
jgi:hypothetical protein